MSRIAWEERIMQRLVVETGQIVGTDTKAIFKTIGRGRPLPQTLERSRKPAVFFWRMQARPGKQEIEQDTEHDLLVGFIIHGSVIAENPDDLTAKDAESIYLEKLLEEKFENTNLNGLSGKLRWRGYDTPLVNQGVPEGTTMPFFSIRHYYERGKPFDPSSGS